MVTHDHPDTARILAFLRAIDIPVVEEPLGSDTFLPAIKVRHGTVVFDPDRLTQPGDLLHEAGHVAVMDPAVRATSAEIADDPGEEMAAIAWSWAAATAIGLDPGVLFHPDGYRGASAWFIETFTRLPPFGVPLLAAWDMTETADYPAMRRWLR